LLLDEMLAPTIARSLRRRGHDAVAIKEREQWHALADDEVIELARREHRAIVTANVRDYRPRAATAATPGGEGHYGMVFIPASYPLTKAATGTLVRALEGLLKAHPNERALHNQETWLS
jgi:hypothetical protein